MNHLLVGCVFAQDFWFLLLRGVGLQILSPQPTAPSFDDWWSDANSRVEGKVRQGLNSLIILGAWSIWNLRNLCVFYGVTPSLSLIMVLVRDELKFWGLAGARGISYLIALAPEEG